MPGPIIKALEYLPPAALVLIISACGSRAAPSPGNSAPAAGSAMGLVRDVGSGPNIEQVRTRLLENVNVVCRSMQENPQAAGEMGKVTAVRESSRKSEKFGDVESVILNYEADIEFSARCEYQGADRKPGDHLAVYGQSEFARDAQGWKQLPLTVWAK